MSLFHALYNAPTDEYVKDLEDEVMELRAKLQVQETALRDTVHAAEMDRDFWKVFGRVI